MAAWSSWRAGGAARRGDGRLVTPMRVKLRREVIPSEGEPWLSGLSEIGQETSNKRPQASACSVMLSLRAPIVLKQVLRSRASRALAQDDSAVHVGRNEGEGGFSLPPTRQASLSS